MTEKGPERALEVLAQPGVIAVFRGVSPETTLATVEMLVEHRHVTAIEVTTDTEHSYSIIRRLVESHGDRFLIGVGTVRTLEAVSDAALSGAMFAAAPATNPNVIGKLNDYGLVPIPGVITPTDIDRALHAGAEVLKVFPAGQLNSTLLHTMLLPFSDPPVVLSGSLSTAAVEDFVKGGFGTFAIGSGLFGVTASAVDEEVLLRSLAGYSRALEPAERVPL